MVCVRVGACVWVSRVANARPSPPPLPQRRALADRDARQFIEAMEVHIGDLYRLQEATDGPMYLAPHLSAILEVARKHRLQLDPQFTRLVVAVITVEGVGRSLDPYINIFQEALPVFWRVRGQMRARVKEAMAAMVRKKALGV